MFLEILRRRNPEFVRAIAALHSSGDLPANCYALDLDAIAVNAAAFTSESARLGLTAFAMTKQLGRNPDVSRVLVQAGITHAVAVDLQCAIAAVSGGLAIGHIGHLVQIPRFEASIAASLSPRYWTVFNATKAQEAAAATLEYGRIQDVLLRIHAPGDRFYPGHEGGFAVKDLLAAADMVDSISGLRFAGVTTFPATLFDPESGTAQATSNRATLTRAAQLLEDAGRTDVEVNAPGTTSVSVLEELATAGATQVEPGHGLTGTTPLHAMHDLVEQPAMAYVSEISHIHNGRAYVFGGGLYVDPVLAQNPTTALIVPPGGDPLAAVALLVEMPAPQAIDYYAAIPLPDTSTAAVGDTVIFGFRAQAFVTRAQTAAIAGVTGGIPTVEGIWAADGSAPLKPSNPLTATGLSS